VIQNFERYLINSLLCTCKMYVVHKIYDSVQPWVKIIVLMKILTILRMFECIYLAMILNMFVNKLS